MSRQMMTLLGVLTSIILVIGILIGFITLYKDTNCTTVIGTQVCRSWHRPAAPSTPAPVSGTPGLSQQGGTWTLDCTQVQCVEPGYPNGPDGSTCQDVVNNQQVCSK